MTTQQPNARDLRISIIADTKNFLIASETLSSTEELLAILNRIKDAEALLIREEGAMIDPRLWKLLHARFVKWIQNFTS